MPCWFCICFLLQHKPHMFLKLGEIRQIQLDWQKNLWISMDSSWISKILGPISMFPKPPTPVHRLSAFRLGDGNSWSEWIIRRSGVWSFQLVMGFFHPYPTKWWRTVLQARLHNPFFLGSRKKWVKQKETEIWKLQRFVMEVFIMLFCNQLSWLQLFTKK